MSDLTLDEFMEAAQGFIEEELDRRIAAETDLELRAALLRNRDKILATTLQLTRDRNQSIFEALAAGPLH